MNRLKAELLTISRADLLRLFDEPPEIKQSPAPMQFTKTCWIIFFGCLTAALNAQVPAPAPPPTITTNNANIRFLSLEETIRLALLHDFNLRIQQLNPQIARFKLESSYGVYDPHLNLVAEHREFTKEGSLVGGVTNLTTRQNVDSIGALIASLPKTDRVDPSFFSGVLPTGMKYELGAQLNHRTGQANKGPIDQYDGDVGLALRQPLLRDSWIDEPRAIIAMAKKDLAISEYVVQLTANKVALAAQQAYYDLMAAADNVKVQEAALSLANQAVADTRERVKQGTMLPLEEKSAESVAASARADVLQAQRQRDLQQNILKSIISDDYEKWHQLSIEPSDKLLAVPHPFSREASWLDGLTYRPDFNQLRTEVEKQGIDVKLRFNQRFPTLDLTGAAGRSAVGSTFGGAAGDITSARDPFWAVGVIVSIPFGFTSERNNYKVAQAKLKQMELQLQDAHKTVIISIDDAVNQAQYAYERIMARREARTYSEAAYEAAVKRLEANKVTSYEVLLKQRDLTLARSLEIQALADYNKALSQLFFNEGTILRRSGFDLRLK